MEMTNKDWEFVYQVAGNMYHHGRMILDKDDFKQECAMKILENPSLLSKAKTKEASIVSIVYYMRLKNYKARPRPNMTKDQRINYFETNSPAKVEDYEAQISHEPFVAIDSELQVESMMRELKKTVTPAQYTLLESIIDDTYNGTSSDRSLLQGIRKRVAG